MRLVLVAATIGAFAIVAGPAFAQQDTHAPAQADSTPGQLDNATDDQASDVGTGASDAFPDSTKIPEPSESGPPIDTAPTDATQSEEAADGDEPR